MMAEKSSLHKFLQELLQEMLQLVVFVKEISCTKFYSKKKSISINFIYWVPDFSEREDLTLPCTENVRKS